MKTFEYRSDILNFLTSLSNDEVFTPPKVAKQMVDLLPPELFTNKDTKFLDPFTKTGVFLREITHRLMEGLKEEIPDDKERALHILHNQVYGMATSSLTALIARRTVYGAKYANEKKYSLAEGFNNEHGNILYPQTQHNWNDGKCTLCGASEAIYSRTNDRETYAYPFIHLSNPAEPFNNMKFDVIIGNPPYQMSDGGAGASAIPIYHKFVEQAKKLNPNYLVMIIPSRWFAAGRGLENFRISFLGDNRLKRIFDYPIASDCFPNVQIKGGVCYFLWVKNYNDACEVNTVVSGEVISTSIRKLLNPISNTFIRYNKAIPFLEKVLEKKEKSFESIVSTQKPFGLRTYYKGMNKYSIEKNIKLYQGGNEISFIGQEEVLLNKFLIDKFKVFLTKSSPGTDNYPHPILGPPIIAEPLTVCTETFIVAGPFDSLQICSNVVTYINTRFFRFLVLLLRSGQDLPKKVYQFVPMQDFSEEWTDEKLYKKYGLTEDEIAYIESMIRPMDNKPTLVEANPTIDITEDE